MCRFQKIVMVAVLFCVSGVLKTLDQNPYVDIIQISSETLKHELDTDRNLFVINVLNKNSFQDCSIPGSINVPVHKLSYFAKKKLSKKDWFTQKPIVVYCASSRCPLSRYACKLLKSVGFNNVWLFQGGMQDWKQKGFPIKGKARGQYLHINE